VNCACRRFLVRSVAIRFITRQVRPPEGGGYSENVKRNGCGRRDVLEGAVPGDSHLCLLGKRGRAGRIIGLILQPRSARRIGSPESN